MAADVRALVLTHGHSDHIGFAERLRRDQGVPVSVLMSWTPPSRAAARPVEGVRHQAQTALRIPLVHHPARRTSHAEAPRGRHLRGRCDPGRAGQPACDPDARTHPWSAALHVPSLGALFVGDAFATYAVTTGARGPQVAPFTAHADQAVASLPRLEAASADLVLPGHGDPWTGGIQEAIRLVREGAAAARG